MKRQNGFTPARGTRLAATVLAAAGTFMLAIGVTAFAQDTPAKPKAQTQTQTKKPAAPVTPSPQPAQPPANEQSAAPAQPQYQLIYSPWTKICNKDQQQAAAKEVCLIMKEARLEVGPFAGSAILVEPEGEPKKILRVILPLGMQIQQGTRVFIDQATPTQRPYVICVPNGCMSDYEADADMVGKLKKGQGLTIQAINAVGQLFTVQLPLGDFAKAYDGPPTDPKEVEERQKKLQEQLQKAAEEARKRLESQQQPQAGQQGAGPTTR
jgi:invasion protein IalB